MCIPKVGLTEANQPPWLGAWHSPDRMRCMGCIVARKSEEMIDCEVSINTVKIVVIGMALMLYVHASLILYSKRVNNLG